MGRGFRSGLLRIHGVGGAIHDVVVDSVFHVGRAIGGAENPLRVRFVFGEQQRGVVFAVQIALAKTRIDRSDDARARCAVPARGSASPGRFATTNGCGTRASAADASRPAPVRGCRR